MQPKNLLFGVVVVGIIATVVMAQSRQNDEKSPERYSIDKQDGHIVRVDKKTGQVSFCDVKNTNIVCRLGADERDAYEDELELLNERIAALEKRLEHSSVRTKRPKEDVPGTARKESKFDKEFNRAMDFAETAMRRFFKVVQDLKKDFESDRI